MGMDRGTSVALVSLAVLVFSSRSTQALAWSNGTDVCNSFGTHDVRYPLWLGSSPSGSDCELSGRVSQ